MNPDGTGQTLVPTNPLPFNTYSPNWSPDGQKLVFAGSIPGQPIHVYVVNADGTGGLTQLTTAGQNGEPAYSPDGTKIVFGSNRDGIAGGNGEIYVMNSDGTGQTRLTNNSSYDASPDWQPLVDADSDGFFAAQGDCNDNNPNIHPGAPELCNGVDDNGNGTVDEGFDVGASCTVGVGACKKDGTKVCTADHLTTECNATPGTPGTEVCNGIDDDCDGAVDESPTNPLQPLTQSCYSGPAGTQGVGVCQAGTQTCSGGTFGACVGEVTPSAEVCDGLDNDCDGLVDANDPGMDVDSNGNGILDSIDCQCPCAGPWKNHGEYVSCVTHAADALKKAGRISGAAQGANVSAAAKSSCGGPK